MCRFEPCVVEIPSFAESLIAAGHCKEERILSYFPGPFAKFSAVDLKGSLVVISYVEAPDAVHIYPSQHQHDLDALQYQLTVDYENDDAEELKLNVDDAKVTI